MFLLYLQEAQIARLEAKISSADRANQRQQADSGFHRGTPLEYADRSLFRRLAESESTVSLSALPDGNYNQSCSVRKSSSNIEILQMSLNTDTSQTESLDDRLADEAIGGPNSGSLATASQCRLKDSRDLGTILDLSENETHFTDSVNDNAAGRYQVMYPDETADTDPESLVGMFLEVKEQAESAMRPQLHDASAGVEDADLSNDDSMTSSNSSKLPKAFEGQTSKKGKSSILSKPTLASRAKTTKVTKQTNSNTRKSSAGSGLPKPKLKTTSVSGSKNQSKSKVPTSKPKSLNYYPENLFAAANTAKANIAKMMKSVDEMYTPSLDYHVSTYIQDISDLADISDMTPSKDTGAAVAANVSDSSDDSDHTHAKDDAQSKGEYYDNSNHGYNNLNDFQNSNQGDSNHGNKHDSNRSCVHSSNNNNYIDKSTVSSLGNYSTPDVGISVSDSNLAVSSNPGTGSPSDVDDDGEETLEIVRGESEHGFEELVPEVELLEDNLTHDRHTDWDDSDSSLEPGMQRAKLFVAVNQGKIEYMYNIEIYCCIPSFVYREK